MMTVCRRACHLLQARSQTVVNVEDADRSPRGVTGFDHEQPCDFVVVHECERLCGQLIGCGDLWVASHHLSRILVEKIATHVAGQIAVCNDSAKSTIRVSNP